MTAMAGLVAAARRGAARAQGGAARLMSGGGGGGIGGGVTVKGRKRFYKTVDVEPVSSAEGFAVTLDGRAIKTPHRNDLILPSEALAEAVAFEWRRQKEGIEPASMPLMTLSCTATDIAEDRRQTTTEELLRYFSTDTVLFPGSPDETEAALLRLQRERWSPLVRWMSETYGEVSVCHDVMIEPHPEETEQRVLDALRAADAWKLTALDSLAAGCKSLIIPLALADGVISAREALHAARVEEEHQMRMWGLVEGGHDVDRAHTTAQVAAASVFLRLASAGEQQQQQQQQQQRA